MDNSLTYKIIGCAMEVYKTLGPGLLESVYERALMYELELQGLKAQNQVPVSVNYKGQDLGEGLRLDILVEDEVIVELKSVEEIKNIHCKQLGSYLKLCDKRTGLLINFNVDDLMDGIKRIKNGYEE